MQEAFEPYGGLMVHWQLMGPTGWVSRPPNATMLAYTDCVPKEKMQVGGLCGRVNDVHRS